jgi:YjjI family glycine radical enzyme
METPEIRALARAVVDDPALTYRQRVQALAALAENVLEPPPVSDACAAALDKRVICDMYEGNAPYRPRYVLPDYAVALRSGSTFLELPPAQDLEEALAFLLILYSQVPSITGYPVYLGDLDALLAPYIDGVSDDELHRRLRLLWISLDRMLPDAFTHTDLGPDDSRVGRTVLRLERELLQVVPNITLRVDPLRTPDDYLLDAVRTVFECGKPHFVNHPMMTADLGERYAAVSCYNSLKIGGGSHTLVRLNLKEAVLAHGDGAESFLAEALPRLVELTCELAESRVRHLVERACFYEHSWLVHEGLVSLDRFSAMFGVFGLAEAVDRLMEHEGHDGARYGHDTAANELSYRITERVAELVADRPVPYCEGNGGRMLLHSQSGIDLDVDVTAGTRVPVGTEPPLPEHLATVAPHHRLFAAGVSDVLAFDDTARRNPQAVVDVIRGAFVAGMRDFTFNLDSNDFVRITGYLVRKSDLARQAAEGGARHGSDFLAAGSMANSHLADRVPKRVISGERAAGPGR